ncbi:uncharacterized protein YALI1_C23028g [Yarrowia lipolytica]|uniref:Uncharacterized protein n=1 Tax=Yarrowia lipolytica TaxID=4952 RepID=A0A1D8NBD7_YARLL|nr:hypothetical protein YALI1_C23028g [Yarrowia lipolytica]
MPRATRSLRDDLRPEEHCQGPGVCLQGDSAESPITFWRLLMHGGLPYSVHFGHARYRHNVQKRLSGVTTPGLVSTVISALVQYCTVRSQTVSLLWSQTYECVVLGKGGIGVKSRKTNTALV